MSSVCEDFRAAWTSTWSWHRSTFSSVSLPVRPRYEHWIVLRVFVVRSCEYCRKGFLHHNQLYAHHKQYHPSENESKMMISFTTTGCFTAERKHFDQGILSFLDQRMPEDLWVCYRHALQTRFLFEMNIIHAIVCALISSLEILIEFAGEERRFSCEYWWPSFFGSFSKTT